MAKSKNLLGYFGEMYELEPRLARLHTDSCAAHDDKKKKSFCANRVWHREFTEPGQPGWISGG
jgi:hypothetical protein